MAKQRPNILFILTDQQRFDALGTAGNPIIKTPNLDRLAREGTLFSSAYTASPVCVPARSSLLTGQYPLNTGCFDNSDPMPEDRPTLMEHLTEAGYRTHGVGKMHFTPDPQALRGFQTRLRQEVGSPERREDDDYLMFLAKKGFGHVHDPYGPLGAMYYVPQPAQMPAELHGTQWVGDHAVQFIYGASAEVPFFLFASFFHPHPPFSPPTPWNKLYRASLMPLPKRPSDQEDLQTYANRQQNRRKYRANGIDDNLVRTIKAYYYACISFIDLQVGRLLHALEETGQLDRTLIVFASDHGEFLGDYDCFGKRSMLDVAARVPLIFRYPERFPSGAVQNPPVSLVDLMPTMLDVAQAAVPDQMAGLSLAAVESLELENRTVYAQFQQLGLGVHMAVNGRWKYIYSAPDRKEFLFDRLQDPQETRNQAGLGLRQGELHTMREGLFRYYQDQGYNAPLERGKWKLFPQPARPTGPDAGLGTQDAVWSQPLYHIPGYSD